MIRRQCFGSYSSDAAFPEGIFTNCIAWSSTNGKHKRSMFSVVVLNSTEGGFSKSTAVNKVDCLAFASFATFKACWWQAHSHHQQQSDQAVKVWIGRDVSLAVLLRLLAFAALIPQGFILGSDNLEFLLWNNCLYRDYWFLFPSIELLRSHRRSGDRRRRFCKRGPRIMSLKAAAEETSATIGRFLRIRL